MFKLDSDNLASLAHYFDERDIANLGAILEYIQQRPEVSTLSPEQVKEGIKGLELITKLQLGGKFYLFHTQDDWVEEQTGGGEGYHVIHRAGDELINAFPGSWNDQPLPDEDKILDFFQRREVSEVYTGDIPIGGFLGLEETLWDDESYAIRRRGLDEQERGYFDERGLRVIHLDSLL